MKLKKDRKRKTEKKDRKRKNLNIPNDRHLERQKIYIHVGWRVIEKC